MTKIVKFNGKSSASAGNQDKQNLGDFKKGMTSAEVPPVVGESGGDFRPPFTKLSGIMYLIYLIYTAILITILNYNILVLSYVWIVLISTTWILWTHLTKSRFHKYTALQIIFYPAILMPCLEMVFGVPFKILKERWKNRNQK